MRGRGPALVRLSAPLLLLCLALAAPGTPARAAEGDAPPPGDGPSLDPGIAGDVEAIEVTASAIDEAASREQADEQIHTFSGEAMSDFSVPDVAAGLRFVPGVNVVDGQFAVIRGLEDRYNSTLFNSAPIPSPDPDSQSVQLDLFPSDIVSNLVIAKTFAPDLPSNSAGGSVNILTNSESYDQGFELKLSAGTGWNEGAAGRFIDLEGGSPIGKEKDARDTIESEYGATLRGVRAIAGRELQYKGVLSWEVDYASGLGYQETREPREAGTFAGRVVRPGDLSRGNLTLSGGRFDLAQSGRAEQGTAYLGFGLGLDEEGNHALDTSAFYTRKVDESVVLKEDGYLPGFDYGPLAASWAAGQSVDGGRFSGFATDTTWIAAVRPSAEEPPTVGPLWLANFNESRALERQRDLLVTQLNGDHWIDALEGLHLGWAANYARTTQDEHSSGVRFYFEPADPLQIPGRFPATVPQLAPGGFLVGSESIYFSRNDIGESQTFGRLDADYETDLGSAMTLKVTTGLYFEQASRDVASGFLENPSAEGRGDFILGRPTPLELGKTILSELDRSAANGNDLAGLRHTRSDAERTIRAWNLGLKSTLFEQLDVLGGMRFEHILIESRNDPFTGEVTFDGTPAIFPTKWLYFDRLDNPDRHEISRRVVLPKGMTFNDQLLGIRVPIDRATGLVDLTDRAAIESLVNGEISKRRTLPSLAFTYRPTARPLLGLTLRGGYSQTVARPSFRELGYYVSVEPGTDDLIVGNPQLGLSDVESFDLRAEYSWSGLDLVGLSVFAKTIDRPIESVVVRNPLNRDSSALWRTFFNNPHGADLRGVEVEAHKNLAFLGPELASYFSLGGNYTFIDAEVERIDAELERARNFFRTSMDDPRTLDRSRRLFGQPEWIANLNLTFDHPDWGTKVTIAFFAISDVLDAAGSVTIGRDGSINSYTPDRYADSYNQLDLTVSQTWRAVTFKLAVKNLTDTTRRIVYDADAVRGRIPERSYKVGRDVSFSISCPF